MASRQTEEINKSIDRLFTIEGNNRREEIKFFLERLHTSYSEAHRSLIRQLLAFPTVWLIAYAIRERLVSGGEVVSFKIEKLELLLIAVPFTLGVISYLLFAALNA